MKHTCEQSRGTSAGVGGAFPCGAPALVLVEMPNGDWLYLCEKCALFVVQHTTARIIRLFGVARRNAELQAAQIRRSQS